MTTPFTSLFSAVILAYVRTINKNKIKYIFKSFNSFNFGFQILGFILGVIYAIDAYWAFKYYKGFP